MSTVKILRIGTSVAAANDLALGVGSYFVISGNTQINGIKASNAQNGQELKLQFSGTPTVKHSTAASAGYASLLLAGAADFAATADDVISLVFDGTYWREYARTAI
jgi:hypothetical protein